MNFNYYANLYLKFGKSYWKHSTYIKNLGIVKNRLNFFNDYDIKDIKVTLIKNWIYEINDVSNKSKKHYISSLNCILNIALEDEVIKDNPLKFLKKIKIIKQDIRPFKSCEVKNILNLSKKITNKNFFVFLFIGFFTGMRTGEIIALKTKDIDLDNKIIYINTTRSRFGENLPKTKTSKRVIPILDILYPILKNHISNLNNNCIYLLQTYLNKPYRDSNVFLKYWNKILKQLNLDYRRLYVMRHTYATNMLINNLVTPVELSYLLGHSSPKMIYDVYVRYINKTFKNFDRSIEIYV